jgi:3-phenylpropionate/trans-cinnamate dioxygenase ferredoxin subunit
MSATIPLIELSALPEGRGRRVCKAGLDLALFKIGDAVYAIEDSCPHNGGSLSQGKVQGKRVKCPVHGLSFSLEHVCPPGPPTLEAKKYAVHVEHGMVMLATDDPLVQHPSAPAGKETP